MTTTVASIATAVLASLATWIVHLIWPRTAPAPATAAPPTGTTILPGINIAMKAESAGLSWLVPLLKALETANGPLIQVEARFLHRLVEQQGGFAKLIESAVDQVLEARLAAGKAKWLVRFATDGGITPRELLDELEGKSSAPSPVSVVAAPLIAFALLLFGASSASAAYPLGPSFAAGPGHWNADVHAPQSFYPTELPLIADRAMRDCNLPEPKPAIFIQYFYATWCGDCKKSTAVARDLEDKGYQVLKTDAGSESGARTASVYKIKSVPFWIVSIDYQTALRTNDPQAVLKLLSAQPKAIGYRIGGTVVDGDGNPISQTQWSQPVYYTSAVYAPDGSCATCNFGQPYQQQGYWGRDGRWYPGKYIVHGARQVRGWFAHRRFRPLARLFGRC